MVKSLIILVFLSLNALAQDREVEYRTWVKQSYVAAYCPLAGDSTVYLVIDEDLDRVIVSAVFGDVKFERRYSMVKGRIFRTAPSFTRLIFTKNCPQFKPRPIIVNNIEVGHEPQTSCVDTIPGSINKVWRAQKVKQIEEVLIKAPSIYKKYINPSLYRDNAAN